MSGYDLVRVWKDADERGEADQPSGEIDLTGLSGGLDGPQETLFQPWSGCCYPDTVFTCPGSVYPYVCPTPRP